MKAGREMDTKVAEFMGWKILKTGTFVDWGTGEIHKNKVRLLTDTMYGPDGQPHPTKHIPLYSTDISEAMPVLEKMMLRGDVFIEWWQDGEWFICDQPVGYRDDAIKANCDGKETGKPSLPLAICRFVIKVMEAENE